jgi:membrane fusion protein (multidrug efflux system)
MKRTLGAIVLLAAFGAVAWFVWFQPRHEEAPEEKHPTEVPVHVAPIVRTTMHGYVTAYGVVEAAPASSDQSAASSRVASSVAGVLTTAHCVEGQRVEKGAPLFQLDTRSVDVAMEFARKTVERQRKLAQVDGTSQRAVQDAEQLFAAAQTQRSLLLVVAPIAGTVTRVNVNAGEAVDLSTVLAELVDLDRLVVSAKMAGPDLSAVRTGQVGEAIATQSTNSIRVNVTFIGSMLDPTNGTVPLRAAIPPGSSLRPGQLITLRIITGEHQDCLAVPVECVVRDAEEGDVVSVVEGSQAVRKAVKLGLREGKLVEVISPELKPDMLVVTEGSYHLPQTTKVRVTPAQP